MKNMNKWIWIVIVFNLVINYFFDDSDTESVNKKAEVVYSEGNEFAQKEAEKIVKKMDEVKTKLEEVDLKNSSESATEEDMKDNVSIQAQNAASLSSSKDKTEIWSPKLEAQPGINESGEGIYTFNSNSYDNKKEAGIYEPYKW